MSTTVTRSITVHRAATEAAKVATDPCVVLPIVGGLGRFEQIETDADGLGEWDLFLDVGSVHVGGRVVVERPDPNRLMWHSIRGTHHQLELTVVEGAAPGESLVTIAMSLQLAGAITGRIAEFLAAGIMARHLEAGLQQLRHHLEFEV
ncbi:MAG TPA: SRPBCC family protein [Aeromicrobium sp.]|nr:SRPBCC family protein [Aeromicrobium sp.]